MTTQRLPPTALCLWPLVHGVRSVLQAKVPIPATVVGVDADVLVVAVGSGTPFRLLLLHSGADGLVRVKLWQVKRQLEEVVNEVRMSELVPDLLKKIAQEFSLTA